MQQKRPVASIVNHIGLKHASMVNITCPTHGPHTVMRAQLPDGQWYTGRCPICSAQDVAEDTGYFPVDKEAQERRRVVNAIEDAKIPPLYRSYTFEAYKVVDGMTMSLSYQCKQLLAGHVQNLVFTGKTDTGKSHLLVATLIEAIRQGRSVRYTTEVDMLAEIKEAFHLYGSDRKAMQMFSDYDVLAIDEIGNFFRPVRHGPCQVHENRRITNRVTERRDWIEVRFGLHGIELALLDSGSHIQVALSPQGFL